MKKKNVIVILLVVVVCVLIATRKTQRDHVEALQKQLPDAISFITENRELTELILEIKDRISEYNAEHSDMQIVKYIFHPQDGDDEQLTIQYDYEYLGDDRPSKPILFSEEEKEIINQAGEVEYIWVGRWSINILYAESGWATLSIRHPLSVAQGIDERGDQNFWYLMYDEKSYRRFWYYEIVDENWVVEIFNVPKN